MFDRAAKAVFHLLARSAGVKRLASRHGMRKPTSFARRFIAGETVEAAITAARAVEAQGLLQTLDYLGESVQSSAEADAATRDYLRVIDAVNQAGIIKNLSLKLTQLGLTVDRATAVDNMRRILDAADEFFVRIDMESSAYTDVTLEVFETLWQQEYRNIGVVLQSELYRTDDDITRVNRLGARIRLVKGAYKEPATVAHQRKADVDAAYMRHVQRLLLEGTYPAIATHDPVMIERTQRFAAQHTLGSDRFEFQMLYGIRRDLQLSLAKQGHRMRIYIPFGREWFPYFMRRLGERPSNVAFVLRSVLREG
ncbi:MAG: proline dehydrogenase [Acidimicrobiia bacterium]|nr:proline dehydrogenase [Acidimicrobiia bacterium]